VSKTPGSGRTKGTPNKATVHAREAIAAFVDQNAPLLNELLQEIRIEDGPKAAFECIRDLIEYHVPKLARSDVNVKGEVAVNVSLMSGDERL
jgi:hypothetical protein